MNNIDKIYHETPAPKEFARGYLRYLSSVLERIDCNDVAKFIDVLVQARNQGSRIFFIGNGGSAATASHFANDLSIGTRSWKKPFKVASLTDNQAVVTAIGNDFGYEQIFTIQLKTQMQPRDVVVAISASGNSPNILQAVEYAKANGAVTVGLTGFDGGKLKPLCHVNVHALSSKGEYGPVEDVHMILDHLVGSFLIKFCESEVEHGG